MKLFNAFTIAKLIIEPKNSNKEIKRVIKQGGLSINKKKVYNNPTENIAIEHKGDIYFKI
jgi:hypothetical protein